MKTILSIISYLGLTLSCLGQHHGIVDPVGPTPIRYDSSTSAKIIPAYLRSMFDSLYPHSILVDWTITAVNKDTFSYTVNFYIKKVDSLEIKHPCVSYIDFKPGGEIIELSTHPPYSTAPIKLKNYLKTKYSGYKVEHFDAYGIHQISDSNGAINYVVSLIKKDMDDTKPSKESVKELYIKFDASGNFRYMEKREYAPEFMKMLSAVR